MLTFAMKIYKGKGGVTESGSGLPFYTELEDVYEKKTPESSPERGERARESVTQTSVGRVFQAGGTASAKVLRWQWNV